MTCLAKSCIMINSRDLKFFEIYLVIGSENNLSNWIILGIQMLNIFTPLCFKDLGSEHMPEWH